MFKLFLITRDINQTHAPSSVPNHIVASLVSCGSLLRSLSNKIHCWDATVWSNEKISSLLIGVVESSSSLESISSKESTVVGTSEFVFNKLAACLAANSFFCCCCCCCCLCSSSCLRWRCLILLPVLRPLCDGT
jgi:hypothetical protein